MKKKSLCLGAIILLAAGFLAGSFLEKSEAKLKIIKAQVYLFKKVNPENKIIFHYHDALSKEAIVTKSFPNSETLEIYWDQLLRSW
jgi:hypothetical protein